MVSKKLKVGSIKSKPTIKDCDIVFSKYIRLKYKKCLRCHTENNLQCSHIFSIRYKPIRWFEDNAICLCYGCHILYFHNRPIEKKNFEIKMIGEEKYNQLEIMALQSWDRDTWAIMLFYETKIKELEVKNEIS